MTAAVERSVRISRLSPEEREILNRNPESMRRRFPPVPLDSSLDYVVDAFWELRRTTPNELGVTLPAGMNRRLRRLLMVCDGAYMSAAHERVDAQPSEEVEEARAVAAMMAKRKKLLDGERRGRVADA